MLTTSAGWIWSRESQKEIQESKAKFEKDVITIKSDLEARYKETLTERRRAVASLELQLEKERQRVSGYKQALASQSQHLVDERKKLQKVNCCLINLALNIVLLCFTFWLCFTSTFFTYKERDALEGEKQRQVNSGAAGAALHDALQREDSWYNQAVDTLKELESQLVERQNIYCSYIQRREQRREVEKSMLRKASKVPIGAELDLVSDLNDIFDRDTHCADVLNEDKRKNGSLMWVYLKYWRLQVSLQKHKRAEEAILAKRIQAHAKWPWEKHALMFVIGEYFESKQSFFFFRMQRVLFLFLISLISLCLQQDKSEYHNNYIQNKSSPVRLIIFHWLKMSCTYQMISTLDVKPSPQKYSHQVWS